MKGNLYDTLYVVLSDKIYIKKYGNYITNLKKI